jgi:hypothetical protein
MTAASSIPGACLNTAAFVRGEALAARCVAELPAASALPLPVLEDQDGLPASVAMRRNELSTPIDALSVFAIFEILLIGATWNLWWGGSDFPVCPVIIPAVPVAIDRMILIAFLLNAFLIAVEPWICRPDSDHQLAVRARSFAALLWASCRFRQLFTLLFGTLLAVENQHRLQPWHWLFLLMLMIQQTRDRQRCTQLMQHVIATIYVCSALSRIATDLTGDMTTLIIRQLLDFAGMTEPPGPTGEAWFRWCLIIGEGVTGLLLLLPRFRRFGLCAAMGMHIALLMALGPPGLNHHPGVLLWNLCMLVAVPILFARRRTSEVHRLTRSDSQRSRGVRFAFAVIWLFPLSGLLGIADNWPSWQLYSSRPERIVMMIREDQRELIPNQLQPFIGRAEVFSEWVPVMLDRWSLQGTGSPVYPEDRFQLWVIGHLLQDAADEIQVRIVISEPEFLWWRRRERTLKSREELTRELTRFLLLPQATQKH